MRERMCQWQNTVLETKRNIHVSRCDCRASKFRFSLIHKEICERCPHRIPIEGEDKLVASLANDVYVELESRQDEEVEQLLDICKVCDNFDAPSGTCNRRDCDSVIPLRDLMRSPQTHCPLRLW